MTRRLQRLKDSADAAFAAEERLIAAAPARGAVCDERPHLRSSSSNRYLWGAATLLRGTIDAGDYKQFIFPLLFYKRLCDVFDEETRAALEESGGDAEFAQFPENHRFQVPPEGAHWEDVRHAATQRRSAHAERHAGHRDGQPRQALRHLRRRAVDEQGPAVRRDAARPHRALQHAHLTLANLPEDELGQGYEYLIKKFADDSGHTAPSSTRTAPSSI